MLKNFMLACLLLSSPTFAEAGPWAPALSGKHLCFVTATGRTDICLMPNGQFTYRRDSVAAGAPDGNWSVDGNTLVLQFSKGATRSYQLEAGDVSNEVSLNGSPYNLTR